MAGAVERADTESGKAKGTVKMNGDALENTRDVVRDSGLHLADIAVAINRSVPYVSLQLAGKRPLTLELCNAVLELAKQKDERVQLLKEGSSLLFHVMQSRMAAGEIEEAQRVGAIATLLEGLAAEIGKTPEPAEVKIVEFEAPPPNADDWRLQRLTIMGQMLKPDTCEFAAEDGKVTRASIQFVPVKDPGASCR